MAYIMFSFAAKLMKSRKKLNVLLIGHIESQYLNILPEVASNVFDHIIQVKQKKSEIFVEPHSDINNTSLSDTIIENISKMHINNAELMIGGYHKERHMLEESVKRCLIDPSKLIKLGVNPSYGILLYGPPGCGKTLLIKKLAQKVKVAFYAIKIPDIVKSFVGESEKAIMDIFQKAAQLSPCILFLDEIDALFSKALSDFNAKVCYQFCSQMDDLVTSKKKILVVAATNHKESIHPSILSPNRLDRMIRIGLPNEEDRKEIIELTLSNLDKEERNYDHILNLTKGMTGADIQEFLRKTLTKRNLFSNDQKVELQ